jgi:hypothetical protein
VEKPACYGANFFSFAYASSNFESGTFPPRQMYIIYNPKIAKQEIRAILSSGVDPDPQRRFSDLRHLLATKTFANYYMGNLGPIVLIRPKK